MAEPYLSEIRMVSFNFPPKGWALANGQLLPINQNQALFSLLGTTYGGDGRVVFALPNLQGRTPMHEGLKYHLGEQGGEEAHTLSIPEMPAHNHVVTAVDAGPSKVNDPTSAYLANSAPNNFYSSVPSGLVALHPATISNAGNSQAHNNMQPYLVISFCIALRGIFPSPS